MRTGHSYDDTFTLIHPARSEQDRAIDGLERNLTDWCADTGRTMRWHTDRAGAGHSLAVSRDGVVQVFAGQTRADVVRLATTWALSVGMEA